MEIAIVLLNLVQIGLGVHTGRICRVRVFRVRVFRVLCLEILIPNPTEAFSDLYIFGFLGFGFGRVRVGKSPFSGLWHFFAKIPLFDTFFLKNTIFFKIFILKYQLFEEK